MKRRRTPALLTTAVCSLSLLVSPLSAVAEGEIGVPVAEPVIIAEIQTGAAAAGDEFIEIYNTSDSAVDITGWQLRYANAGTETTTVLATVTSPDEQPVELSANSYYTFRTSDVVAPGAGQTYSAGLAKTDKTVALFAADSETCQLAVVDAVAWAVPAAAATKGEAAAIDSTATSTKEKLLRRLRDSAGRYIDTNNNSFDFVMSASAAGGQVPAITDLATPGADNQPLLLDGAVLPVVGPGSSFPPAAMNDCVVPPDPTEEPGADPDPLPPVVDDSPPSVTEPSDPVPPGGAPQPVIPAANIGLKTPLLSEFLPNPASPQTDKDDEFIELYNPNNTGFDLSGYVLEIGLQTKKRYTIPQDTSLPAHSFLALFSADTGVALSNSGSQVALFDPLGQPLVVSEAYGTAKDGQSWVLASGRWQWTTKPTPNALNVVAAPQVKTASAKKTKVAAAAKTKGSSAQAGGTDPGDDVQQAAAVAASASTPLHPGVLALIGASALLYGAYEYRHDVANKLYQLRSNRAARRAARQSAQGR